MTVDYWEWDTDASRSLFFFFGVICNPELQAVRCLPGA
jgi:hypothetical protein